MAKYSEYFPFPFPFGGVCGWVGVCGWGGVGWGGSEGGDFLSQVKNTQRG